MCRFKITHSNGDEEYIEDVVAIDTADSPEIEEQRDKFREATMIEMTWGEFKKNQESRGKTDDSVVYGAMESRHKTLFTFCVYTIGENDESKRTKRHTKETNAGPGDDV